MRAEKHTKRGFWKDGLYWFFRSYLQFFHDHVYYRKVWRVGAEQLPPLHTPMLIACNHQNSLNDPLALELKMGPRIVSIFARADVFSRPIIARFLRALYILPAYRMRDGEQMLQQNYVAFSEAAQQMNKGNAVAIFPEALNQTCHWLGEFSQGYLRMVFSAAEATGFQQDIVLQPVALHYENYYHMLSDMVITYCEPVHLKDYYERFRQKPRTVQRELNTLVRNRIQERMLDIRDLENYEAIDYLRETFGIDFAIYRGKNPKKLPEKLTADQELVALLDERKAKDPEGMAALYSDVLQLKAGTHRLGIRDWNLAHVYSAAKLLGGALGLLLLLPLYLFALVPNIIVYFAPERMARRFKAMGGTFVMFVGGIRFIVSALVSIPVCYGLTFLADGFLLGWNYWWVALLHLLALPWLGVFAWYYHIWNIKWRSCVRSRWKEKEVEELRRMRENIWEQLKIGI